MKKNTNLLYITEEIELDRPESQKMIHIADPNLLGEMVVWEEKGGGREEDMKEIEKNLRKHS